MHRVRAGDVSMVSLLFERHHRRLFRYCWQMTGKAQPSEDLVQEVFLRRRESPLEAAGAHFGIDESMRQLRAMRRLLDRVES